MLVPSTFTGWYKKMMMKAEMAREMTRSRSQTPRPLLNRAGDGGIWDSGSEDDAADKAVFPADPESLKPAILTLLYTEAVRVAQDVVGVTVSERFPFQPESAFMTGESVKRGRR